MTSMERRLAKWLGIFIGLFLCAVTALVAGAITCRLTAWVFP